MTGGRARTYVVEEETLTFDEILERCRRVPPKTLRDRLWRGERKWDRLKRPPDIKGFDKPKPWR